MKSSLKSLFKKLKLNQENGLIYKNNQINVPERIKHNLEFIDYDAIYLINENPLIIFKEYSDINEFKENFEEFHNDIWNLNDIPIIFVVIPDEIRIYNANIFDENDAKLDIFNESDFKDIIDINTLINTSFDKYSDSFSKSKRVQDYLLENIKETRKILSNDLPLNLIHNLIGKLIFSKYLIDRDVLSEEFFLNNFSCTFEELFKNKDKLFDFFSVLDNFNQDLFKIHPKDMVLISKSHLNILKMLFDGRNMKNYGQDVLICPYNFKIIPIEVISNIYEIFLRDSELENGKSYYTPLFLVDYILNRTLDKKLNDNLNCKILDPTCGSGVFLVESLRRMIKKYKEEDIELTPDVLINILKNNIFGIDSDENAINIAILSIQLTIYDYLSKNQIEEFELPKLKNENFFVNDLFDLDAEFNKLPKFDLIIGNPPWGAKQDLAIEYCEKNHIPISNKEIVQAILIRVGDFANINTDIALISSSKVLYNHNASKFREYFLNNFNLKIVLELSPIKKEIFINAIGPAAILFYNKNFSNFNIVEHISLKPNKLFYLLSSVVVQKSDVKYIPQKDLIEHDWVWKVLLYGNILDFQLIRRLKNMKTIRKYIDENNLIMSTGIQESSNPQLDASKYFKHDYLDVGRNKKMLHRYYIDESNVEKWSIEKVHRIRDDRIFNPPYVLMKTGLNSEYQCVSTYSEKQWVFKNAVRVIKGSNVNKKILKSIVGFLNSKFLTYYSFLTFSSIGVEREQVLVEEILDVPLVVDDTLIYYVDEILQAHIDSNEETIKSFQKRIDSLILDLLSFDDEEKDSFNYLFDITIPMINNESKAFRTVNDMDLIEYSELFLNHFKFYFNDGEFFHVIIHKSDLFVGIEFKIEDKKPDDFIDFRNDEGLLNLLGNLSLEDQNNFHINRDIKGFNETSFYVIKSNEYKNWHKAIARLDINEFMESLIHKGE